MWFYEDMGKKVMVIIGAAVLGGGVILGGYFLSGAGQPRETPLLRPTLPPVVTQEPQERGIENEKGEGVQRVELVSGNFFFEPNELSVKEGKVEVAIKEISGFHTFVIDELGVKETLKTGKTFSFEAPAGTYEFYCDVPGHREAGMVGTSNVQSSL